MTVCMHNFRHVYEPEIELAIFIPYPRLVRNAVSKHLPVLILIRKCADNYVCLQIYSVISIVSRQTDQTANMCLLAIKYIKYAKTMHAFIWLNYIGIKKSHHFFFFAFLLCFV